MNASLRSASTSSADLPVVISKITRADMNLILPRLDDECKNEDGSPSPSKRAHLQEQIAKCEHVYDLGGRITDVKTVKGRGDEPGVRFVGKFKSHTSPAFGDKWFVAGRAHVPKFFEEQLYAEVLQAKNVDPNATLDFMIRVGMKPPKPGKPSTVGYEWTVQTLISIDVTEDPVQKLFDAVQGPALIAHEPATSVSAEAATPVEVAPEATREESGRGNGRRASR